MQQHFRDSLGRSKSPDLVNQLNNLDQQYANFKTYANASSRAGAAQREGYITPSDYISQILGDAKKDGNTISFQKGQLYNQDFANDAKKVIGNEYPDSGTAGRMMQSSILPTALGALAYVPAKAAYSDLGQKALEIALTKRPLIAPAIANYVKQASPVLGSAAAPKVSDAVAQLLKQQAN
jgi:hypothetical protein